MAPDTIKIEVKKLGQGVVYNEIRKQAITTDAPNGLAKTLEHGTCNVAGRSDAEYFVVAGDQSTGAPAAGANAPAPEDRLSCQCSGQAFGGEDHRRCTGGKLQDAEGRAESVREEPEIRMMFFVSCQLSVVSVRRRARSQLTTDNGPRLAPIRPKMAAADD